GTKPRAAGGGGRPPAELLLPPVGVAPVELGLDLPDVRGEVPLLLAEPLLEVVDDLLAPLELLQPKLDVGFCARLACLDVGFALVEIADARGELVLRLVQPLLQAFEPRALRIEESLARHELGFTRCNLAFALFEARRELVEIALLVPL